MMEPRRIFQQGMQPYGTGHHRKKYKAKNFTFSQAYNFFWDKIERANIFYNNILATADKPLDSHEVKSRELLLITYF